VLKTGKTILLIGMLFALLYSLVIIISPQTIVGSTLKARGTSLESVQDRGAAGTIIVETRHMGVFGLTTTIAMLFILFTGFKKGQKWAWWAFFIVGTIAWGFGLVTQIIEKDMPNLIGQLIGIVLLYLGLLIPLKEFFPKKA
jgi:hypothetical protein